MKNLLLLLIIPFFYSCSSSNEGASNDAAVGPADLFIGAWETVDSSDTTMDKHIVVIVTDGYLSAANYNKDEQVFISTAVATWEIDSAGRFIETIEFDSNDSTRMGQQLIQEFTFSDSGDSLEFIGEDALWTRVDDGTPGALEGAWLITRRKRDDEIRRSTPGVRKTMKILSGTRFQWVAYNTETAALSGTGGGTYTTEGETYTENIDFFSRDSSRVGASLEFTFALDSGEWHHSGFSSRGQPLYEIWTPRKWLD